MKVKEFIKQKYKYLILFVLFSIFILIGKEVFKKEIFNIDKKIYSFFVLHRTTGLNMFFVTLTELGSAEFLIILTILLIIFVKNNFYRILMPINLAFIGLSNQILKNIFVRERPNELRLVNENGYSFPSGHAMASTAVYGLLIIFAFKHIRNKRLKRVTIFLLSFIILIIDISRIYVGVHYASDVIAGTCLSISYLIILVRLLKRKFVQYKKEQRNSKILEDDV